MLIKNETTQKQIAGNSKIIDYWLNFRQELIVDYSKVAGLTPGDKKCLPTNEKLHRFCETLTDYISAGHFRIYNDIITHWGTTGFSGNDEINRLYVGIVETTGPLLTFSDKYSPFSINDVNFSQFDENLSRVGEIMALRFEKEDMLIYLIMESLAVTPRA